jgi:hypothetical protein
MIIGTVFTLFVVPSIYMLVARKHTALALDEAGGDDETPAGSRREIPELVEAVS